MADIILYSSGTLGDHLPFIALGQALNDRGHRVRLVINQAMHHYAHKAGLEVVALTDEERGPEEARANAWAWDHWNYPPDASPPNAKPFDLERYIAQAREMIALCQGADLLISTSIRSLGYVAHAALELPWLTVSLNPSLFRQPAATEEQLAILEARLREYDAHKQLFSDVFAALGIHREMPLFSKAWAFARHVLLASSSHFSQPDVEQLQPRSSLDLTGFWFYEEPDWRTWQPSEKLRRFMERRPLVLSFSSQPLENPGATLALHAHAAARLQMPLLVQQGWAGFSESDLPGDIIPGEVMFADFLPHDWLFARAACAIQHGGIGSIARALRQGCPMLIEPYGNDQIYNASRVTRLGCGAAMHPFKMTVDGLARTLREQVLAPECRERVQALGVSMRAEDGLATACRAIETYLERVRTGEESRSLWPAPLLGNPFAPPVDIPTEETAASQELRAERPEQSGIPKIVHQTWKDANVPSQFLAYQRTWQDHHPGWRYYLWTDADNRAFLRQHYPWFLSIYDNYPEPIMRADAARYFVLHHYGGVYADLDAECLRSFESLLNDKQLVFGLEPPEHLAGHRSRGYSLKRIVSNAIMASAPGHPFWEHVFQALVEFHLAPSPLDATGPFMLTRALESYPHAASIDIQPAEMLSPVASDKPWRELPPTEQERLAETAYAVHHWAGTWWRPSVARQTEQVEITVFVKGNLLSRGVMRIDASAAVLRQEVALPLISCLMVTGSRPALAQRAVRCFQRQTYANRELVIVDDSGDDALEAWVQELQDPQIVFVRLAPSGKRLGELRNIALERASGTYVAQWDDDDLSDPKRLEIQMAALYASQADACALERQLLWWPCQRRLAVSGGRVWEGSLLCAKNELARYPEISQGEDTPVVERILAQGRLATLDYPQLYVYTFHGANTFSETHWEELWQAATQRFEDETYEVMLQQIQEQIQEDLASWDSRPGVGTKPQRWEKQEDAQTASIATKNGAEVMTSAPNATSASSSPAAMPKVLILTPVKDAAPFLPNFWNKLRTLTYPHDRLSLGFLESDSLDRTYDLIAEQLPVLQTEFARVVLFKRDYAYRMTGPRWQASEQYRRRAILAKSRNYLLAQALADEDWVLWVDVDVARWPNDIIERLLATQKDIIVPNCLQLSTGLTFDYNTFKLKPGAENLDWSLYILNGILLPPHGYGRFYLSDLRQHDLVEVDAVGGTMLLIRADIHREGLSFPTFPLKYLVETEGLAVMAREMGYRCWGAPNLEIWHP